MVFFILRLLKTFSFVSTSMQVSLLKSKIHRASRTSVKPDYSGSLSIDLDLMEAAGFLHHDKILVGNITNGERFETYCIPAERGSYEIGLNGAAAHKGNVGDLLVIMTFINLNPEEAKVWEPRLVIIDDNNKSYQLLKSPHSEN